MKFFKADDKPGGGIFRSGGTVVFQTAGAKFQSRNCALKLLKTRNYLLNLSTPKTSAFFWFTLQVLSLKMFFNDFLPIL
jgi:hypothetical protein